MTEPSGPTTQALIATHQLKSWPQYYGPVVQGRKTFEIRKNDRNYAVGDCLIMCEWNPATQQFSGQQVAVRVTYLTDFDQQPGYVVMSIQRMYPAAADALRSLPPQLISLQSAFANEQQRREIAEAEVARLTQARDTLRTALQYVESVYRLNCVAEGEPSSVLEELQRVIKLTAGAEAGPLPAPTECDQCGYKSTTRESGSACLSHPFGSCDGTMRALATPPAIADLRAGPLPSPHEPEED